MKKRCTIWLVLIAALFVTGCKKQENTSVFKEQTHIEAGETTEMQMMINNEFIKVEWESNESVEMLKKMTEKGPLTIQMSMYGGFEQVGPIGRKLPRKDTKIQTRAGDIVLYSGNQMVVFYGSNTWEYTKLGHITDRTAEELEELLGNGDVTIRIGKELK